MIKELIYGGLSATSSDYQCHDGDLDLSLNLLNEDNQIRPVLQPVPVLSLIENERILFVHHVSGSKDNYILARTGAGHSIDIYWLEKDVNITTTTDAIFIASFSGFRDITAIGNTLVLALDEGLAYLLWKDGSYIRLSDRPPFISIDFGMYKVGTLNNSDSFVIPARCAAGWDAKGGRADQSELARMTEAAFGLLNPALAETITSKGFFYQPCFVRYAYRLYDGTHSWHSAPILMLPTILPPFIRYSDDGSSPADDGELTATFTLDVPYFALAYRILSDSAAELENWADIITGIDVFVSAPIYTYDQSKDLQWRPTTNIHSLLSGISPDKKTSEGGGRPGSSVVADEVFIGHYAEGIADTYTDRTMKTSVSENPAYAVLLDIKPHEKFYHNIRSVHEFYMLAQIDIKNISMMESMSPLDIVDRNLDALIAREKLEDDYQSHCRIVPTTLFAYNSRLNLADIDITPAKPFPLRSCMQFGNPDGETVTPTITVWTRLNGTRCHAIHTGDAGSQADSWHSPVQNFPRFIYYPDASAYKMEIVLSDTQKYIVDLTPHDFLNGAYYFRGKDGMGKNSLPQTASPETVGSATSAGAPSKIYTSEANNPFYFPVLGINTVGSGRILGLSTAARALSQGQFGQFPLYAFTTEGVWALELTDSGTYRSKQPITRDVCINPQGITQIDSAVLFPTARGVMLLSGAEVTCISETLHDEYSPGRIHDLPLINKLHDLLGLPEDAQLPQRQFATFLKDCRMIYDYTHQRIIVYNINVSYAYIFSLKSKSWGMMYSSLRGNVNSYPEALAQTSDAKMVDFSQSGGAKARGLLITRPLKFDMPDTLKTIHTCIQRGVFRRYHVQSVLYGSRDLHEWMLIWSSEDHYLRGFSGTPFKYFRIALVCSLEADESISGASVEYYPRKTGQLR